MIRNILNKAKSISLRNSKIKKNITKKKIVYTPNRKLFIPPLIDFKAELTEIGLRDGFQEGFHYDEWIKDQKNKDGKQLASLRKKIYYDVVKENNLPITIKLSSHIKHDVIVKLVNEIHDKKWSVTYSFENDVIEGDYTKLILNKI